MRILLGHSFPDTPAFGARWLEAWVNRLRVAGIDVQPFSLAFEPGRPALDFRELDVRWRYRDQRLFEIYDRLAETLTDYDVFVNYTGANVHPEFATALPCFTVYGCFDDPESSEKLSRHVAAAFDLAMVGNIAEVETYRSWGVRHAHWWPIGFRADDYVPSLTADQILTGERDNEVALLCERVTRFRIRRVDRFVKAFPHGAYYGRGWPTGFLPEPDRVPLLQRTRIGINIHNSTGPINFRTFYLPANGVMQICDNKTHLGSIFALGSEVVGYDSIDEAIDLTRYYIAHDDERRAIAAAGWTRALTDYNEVACFWRLLRAIEAVQAANSSVEQRLESVVVRGDSRSALRRLRDRVALGTWSLWDRGRRALRRTARRVIYGPA